MAPSDDNRIQNLPPLSLPALAEETPVVVSASPPAKLETSLAPPNRIISENSFVTLSGWAARFVVGVFMICNAFPLSFITAIAAFGWLQRRMQAIALRGWWRESPRRLEGTFQQFCDSLGPDAPVERPRWFVRERLFLTIDKLSRGNTLLALVRVTWTLVTLPVHSLWLNFKVGITGLFTTYLLTGLGCLIMMFSWHFGWLNSFHKGYEDAFLGLLSGLLGGYLLIVSLIYVPMAQAHQAAAGEISAFFQFRVVMKLILARLTAYVMLSGGFAFAAVIFTVPRLMTADDRFGPNLEDVTPREAYWLLERHWLLWSIPFFLTMLVLRSLSALIYRSAMLKAVYAGTISTADLPPKLVHWFDKLEILPQAQTPQHVIVAALKTTLSWKYRIVMLGFAFLIWMLFVMWFYFGYFFVFNEYRGVLNHPVVQVPCIDWTPWHLVRGEEE